MTRTDLWLRVLEELGVAADGQSPASSDIKIVSDRYPGVHALLLREKLVSWSVASDEIPAFAEIPLAQALAYYCAKAFGQNPDEYKLNGAISLSGREGGPSIAERSLRRSLAKGFIYSRQRAEYF